MQFLHVCYLLGEVPWRHGNGVDSTTMAGPKGPADCVQSTATPERRLDGNDQWSFLQVSGDRPALSDRFECVAGVSSAQYNWPGDASSTGNLHQMQVKEAQTIRGSSSTSPDLSAAEQGFVAAFDPWWQGQAAAEAFPFSEALSAFHAAGKHFVSGCVTDRLCALRQESERVSGETAGHRRLEAFLDTALDKHEGRYDYGTYCALKVLEFPESGEPVLSADGVGSARDEDLISLLGDLLAFELAFWEGCNTPLPQRRPGVELSKRRMARALRALRPSLQRLGGSHLVAGNDPVRDVRALLIWIEAQRTPYAWARIQQSILPVHVVHDEYMFLRILQSFELNYAWLAVLLRGAIGTMTSDPASALVQLQEANLILREAMRLFPLLATMQVEAFHDFRRFTEGASAIQSAGYKTVESLCRRPDGDRLDSTAYRSVPDVRIAVQAGQATLDEAFAAACQNNAFGAAHRQLVETEMAKFARQLLRWRQAHYEIARRFLGEKGGTGYTEGVPYLADVRQIAVFNTVAPERA